MQFAANNNDVNSIQNKQMPHQNVFEKLISRIE